ncbi:hypothetical protein [Empedobacter brevis]|uniref:hypothetical protein n=1 Tax=Empedobacter brevis TaxID=247 RepID=UPI0039B0A187
MNTSTIEQAEKKAMKVVSKTEKQSCINTSQLIKLINRLERFEYNPSANKKNAYEGKIRFYGYEDMFYTMESLLQITIDSIDLNMDNDINYKTKKLDDIKKVLQVALQLIPLEEGQILSELRESVANQSLNIV